MKWMNAIVHTRTEGKCSGECCRLITLSADPELVAVLAAGHAARQRAEASRQLLRDPPPKEVVRVRYNEDAPFVVNNFVPVRLSYIDGVTGKRRRRSGPKPEMQYRCAKWDGRTKLCTDYENRPLLCSAYGTTPGQPCNRRDCSLRQVHTTMEHLRWENEGGRCE